MYKCGWNGCEKAYGTLNHLNAHVTMQSHGAKRTPDGMCLYLLIVCVLNRVFSRVVLFSSCYTALVWAARLHA